MRMVDRMGADTLVIKKHEKSNAMTITEALSKIPAQTLQIARVNKGAS